MKDMVCLLAEPTTDIECLCFDSKPCDIHIDDGGNLICRHGNNESIVDGVARVICPLEIVREREKWEKFLEQERNEKT